MNKEDFLQILKSILKKIDDVEGFMGQNPPKHIVAYNKILGVQQKLSGEYPESLQKKLFVENIKIKGVVTYFLNGRYVDGMKSLIQVKNNIIRLITENERNSD